MREDVTRRWRSRVYRERLPEGSTTVDLTLGLLQVRLEELPTTWTPWVAEQFAPFASSGHEGRPDRVLHCRRREGPVLPGARAGGATRLEIERGEAGRVDVRSHWQEGWFDLERGEGELRIGARAFDLFTMSVDNFLRVVLQAAALSRGAFLVHAAAVVDGGRAVLMVGPSGTGKSTAVLLSGTRPALADDVTLVDASVGAPVVVPLPLHPAEPPERRSTRRHELAALLRLRQGAAHRIEPLPTAWAVAATAAAVPFARDLGVSPSRVQELVARVVTATPCFELHFARDEGFWPVVQRALGRDPT